MSPSRALLVLFPVLLQAGCGYVHFGRIAAPVTGLGDSAMAAAYSSLATEHKILKQELALVRKEGDALRSVLDRSGGAAGAGAAAVDLDARLTETSRELAALRASYAKLQAERPAISPVVDPAADARVKSDLEERLAVSLRNFTQLQEENVRLRTEVGRTRAENDSLADQLKAAAIQAERTEATVAQLNTDLVAQKEARARSEQVAEAVRTQLSTVLAHGGGPAAANPRESTPPGSSALQIAKAPPAGASPTAELRVNTDQLRKTSEPTAAGKALRVHIVQTGDTLEKIARQYYGVPERWRSLYEANLAVLSSGQPLRVGMELQVPEFLAPQKPD
ncbi:MAG: LysM peptidoglycan-binding domain-containing protein [Opitutus sp.]|nr:LysM peptidoglycan-binding domain-containing protein [Opitutus sp.]